MVPSSTACAARPVCQPAFSGTELPEETLPSGKPYGLVPRTAARWDRAAIAARCSHFMQQEICHATSKILRFVLSTNVHLVSARPPPVPAQSLVPMAKQCASALPPGAVP